MARYSSEQVKQSKEAILASAARLFRTHGYNGVGIKDIVSSAGLTNGTFYVHFSSKAALFDEVICLANSNRDKRFSEMPSVSPSDHACEFIKSYLSVKHLKNKSGGCLMPKLAGDLQVHRTISSKNVDSYIEDFKKIFSECGLKKSDASLISSALVGGLIIARTMPEKKAVSFLNDVKKKCLKIVIQSLGGE